MCERIKSPSGTARLIIILTLIAIALGAMIVIPIVTNKADDEMQLVDEQQVSAAKRQAQIEYQSTNEGFSAVFDTETKEFVDIDRARREVEPYGATKETEGKYLLVTVTDDGTVSTEWVKP